MAYRYCVQYLTPVGAFTSYTNSDFKNRQLIRKLLKRDDTIIVNCFKDGKKVQVKYVLKYRRK